MTRETITISCTKSPFLLTQCCHKQTILLGRTTMENGGWIWRTF